MTRRTLLMRMGAAGIVGISALRSLPVVAGQPEHQGPASGTEGGGPPVRSLQGLPTEEIFAVAFSPDGSHIVTGGKDILFMPGVDYTSLDGSGRPPRIETRGQPPALRVWDAVTGRQLWASPLPAPIYTVGFSSDGTRVASGGAEAIVPTRESVRKNRIDYRGQPQTVPTGRWLITTETGGLVKVWETATGRELLNLAGLETGVIKVAIGRVLASLDYTFVLRLWRPGDGRLTQVRDDLKVKPFLGWDPFFPHHWAVSADAMRIMYVGGGGGSQWDVSAGRYRKVTLEGAAQPIALSPDGGRFATGSRDSAILLWDFKTLELIRRIPIGVGAQAEILAFSRDGSRILAGSEDGTVRLWEGATGRPLGEARGPAGLIRAVAFLPAGGQRIASGGTVAEKEIDPETNLLRVDPLRVWDARIG